MPAPMSTHTGALTSRPRLVLGSTAVGLVAAAAVVSHGRPLAPAACSTACCVGPAMRGCLNAPACRVDPSKAEECIIYGHVDLTDREKKMMACPWVRLRQGLCVGGCDN
uniref:Uncharacterized protein n=1 Tax=Chlamydomonas leiostraca TaxID=1034604 RepID=A0A7S0RYG1_9CHLO|mmetsp:Transcript_34210/g.86544  ORF Transcript_34210/g.86544 Transcript_34210/m.86544 type:complete len:109 (+) Transcript_34210:146-472(+)|eukprot:CAMPEP_0202866052 /NCGR_PEP_ID=MMETSP1391-20130828/7116_1 /ASSEMBLY_ACC=CAM_ASM_000867 /TAXON_ID=1034604 /ORGANISM="Chlamydomonas leiostraca, Strain SAG 11-49" /LENGTH=108 /DNA_ID=CAMNT_0049545961 /DNA_START=146 /DNA_END=472 /DNA_ORIENTATION=+